MALRKTSAVSKSIDNVLNLGKYRRILHLQQTQTSSVTSITFTNEDQVDEICHSTSAGVQPYDKIPGPDGWPLLGTLGTYLFGKGLSRLYEHQVRT